jgi:glycosyltransferase involved in cell wall biosynthesis
MSVSGTPVLSVLVPTHDYGAFLDEALDSVLVQHVDGVEVVVVDDGSTDDTQERMRKWTDHPWVRSVRQANAGPSAARNHAMALARGRYWMFLDADDVLVDGCLRSTVEFLDRHREVGFFFTNYDIFDHERIVSASGVDEWRIFRKLPHRVVGPGEWIFADSLAPAILRHGGFMHTSGLTLRREVAERTGRFREGYSYGEDDDYYARATAICTSGYVDRVLSRKRNHARSLIHDPKSGVRKVQHMLELSELQRSEFAEWPEIQEILRGKIETCAVTYVWGLLESSRTDLALETLRRYVPRYRWSLALRKLQLRAWLQRLAAKPPVAR